MGKLGRGRKESRKTRREGKKDRGVKTVSRLACHATGFPYNILYSGAAALVYEYDTLPYLKIKPFVTQPLSRLQKICPNPGMSIVLGDNHKSGPSTTCTESVWKLSQIRTPE